MKHNPPNPPRGKSATTALYALKMIDALRDGPMITPELCAVLQFTYSGTRNYIRTLEKAGVVTFKKMQLHSPVMTACLVDDAEKIAAYCAELNQHIPRALTVIERQQQRLDAMASAQSAVRVHVAADDEPVKHRRGPGFKVHRDFLVAALFGAPAQRGTA